MALLRRGFYLIVGCTFPGFWMLHASGFGAALFRPIQQWCHSTAVGWPSLVTAVLLYLTAICCFEFCWRLLKNTHP
ncbi:hypothetical protein Despr_0938 [Desulfobulbus propionicus DSM 2032]|uniref:Uncharacterized protein n=1 Tax=Desulfobulbus propionicus (strain ATCC 33891 / DSM 2032 / VKM B-1956 / 1pr3) TaxID=577650 RepID=A0A7U4DNN6_DESPD|nr:hypothetical protein Despr_0938 [Desulfobulbus propionicus DSM 2032]